MNPFKRRNLVIVCLVSAIAISIAVGWLFMHLGAKADQQVQPLSSSKFLKQLADIPLSGGSSRFDYQSLDEQKGLLYIAHLGADSVTVFDTKTQRVVANIEGLPGVHGVLAISELGRVYASATNTNQVAVIDDRTLKIITRTPTGNYPDGIAYDPDDGKIYVSNEFGRSNTVIDVQTNQSVTTIDLGGEVGNTQYDPTSNRIFAAVQTRNQLVVVNPKTQQVVGRYDLPGCDHPHGLFIDSSHRMVYVACEDNAKLVAIALTSMKVTSTQSVGSSPDVLAFDRDWHRLYVASESGVISIFEEQGGKLVKLEDIFVAPKAHSVAVNQQTHNLYLPLERVGKQPVLRIMEAKLEQKF